MAQDTIDPNVPGLDPTLAFKSNNPRIRTITGNAYTAELSDINMLLRFTSATASVLTLPADDTDDFPRGSIINFQRAGAGALTFAAAGGVTISKPATTSAGSGGQHEFTGAMKTSANGWTLFGALAPV